MDLEERTQFLRMIVTSAKVDTITNEGLRRMQSRYTGVIQEIENQLLNYAEVIQGDGLDAAVQLRKRANQLAQQSQILDALTNDVADMTTVAGMTAYPDYNDMLSWDGRIEDFNYVTRNALELKEQIVSVDVGDRKLREWMATLYGPDRMSETFDYLPDLGDQLEAARLKGSGYQATVRKLTKQYGDQFSDDLTTIARSYTQSMNVQAHTDVYKANKDIVRGVTWTAVLENGNFTTGTGTCPRCAALDGDLFAMDEIESGSAPPMPLHPRCRCLWVPKTRSWKSLGIDIPEAEQAYRPWVKRTEEAIGAGGQREILDYGSYPGTYRDWWRTQDSGFQNAVVGIQRARLIRDGEIGFSSIITEQGDLIPIRSLGLDDAALYFARTGRRRDGGGTGGVVPPAPVAPIPPIAPTGPKGFSDQIIDEMDTIEDLYLNDEEYFKLTVDYDEAKQARIARMNEIAAIDDETLRNKMMADSGDMLMAEYAIDAEKRQFKKDQIDAFIRPPDGGKIVWTHKNFDEYNDNEGTWEHMFRETEKMFHPDVLDNIPPVNMDWVQGDRAHYNWKGQLLHMGTRENDVLIHEFGHHVESYFKQYETAMNAFINRRTVGDPFVSINHLGEIGKPDKFFSGYIGRKYAGDFETATEVLSMGVQRMYTDPVGFYRVDPEHFRLTLQAMWNEVE